MEESRRYQDLPQKLQLRLQARFAFAVENECKNSRSRGDKRNAHDLFSAFKESVQTQKAAESQILQTGTLNVGEEGPRLKMGFTAGNENEDLQNDNKYNSSKAEIITNSTIEGKKLLILFQKLRFVKASIVPFLTQLVGHLYLTSKEYGVCADEILYHLEEEIETGDCTVLEALKALEAISSRRDNFAAEVQSLTKVIKTLSSESAQENSLRYEGDKSVDNDGDDYDEGKSVDRAAITVDESEDGYLRMSNVRGTLISNPGHVENAQVHLDRTKQIIETFSKSANELTQRAERRRAHDEKHEQEVRDANIQRVREEFLAQGKHKAKLVQHKVSKSTNELAKTFDYRERRRQTEKMEKILRKEAPIQAHTSDQLDRGDEHDRSEAMLAVAMLEDQMRVLDSQLERARWLAMTSEEQQRTTDDRNKAMEEMRIRVERTKAMSLLKLSVVAKFRYYVKRWRRNKVLRKDAAFRIVMFYRFFNFMRRVRSRVRKKHASEYLAVMCYNRFVLPRRHFLSAVRKVQRFLRIMRYKITVKDLFRKIVTAALEKYASAVKMHLDPVRWQLDAIEEHVLTLSPSDAFDITAARLESLRRSTETAANVNWADVSPLVHGTKHEKILPINDEMSDEIPPIWREKALWSTIEDIWSDAAHLKQRLMFVQSRKELQRIAMRCATRVQYLSDRLDNHVDINKPREGSLSSKTSPVTCNPISPMFGEAEIEGQSLSSALSTAAINLDNTVHVKSESIGPLLDKTLVPKIPNCAQGDMVTSRIRGTSHHVSLTKEPYQPAPPMSSGETKGGGGRGTRSRARKIKVSSPPPANKKGKSITTRMPTGVQEMIGGDDGEDDDVVAENGARFQLMMDHGAKVQKEILLAKLLRLKRVLSSRLHSYAEKEAHLIGRQRERAFVVKNFSKEVPEMRVQTQRDTRWNAEPRGTEFDNDLSTETLQARVILVGDLLPSPTSMAEVQHSITSKAVRENTCRQDLLMWTNFSVHLCSRIPILLSARGLYPTSWRLPHISTHSTGTEMAIPSLGYVPDLSIALPDEVLQGYLLLQSGRSPTMFATGRGGLNLFSKHDLLSSAKSAIPPKGSEQSRVTATLLNSSRAEAVHHLSELTLSGALTLPVSHTKETTSAPCISHLVVLAAEDFSAETDTEKLLKELVMSFSIGSMSMFRCDAGSVALDPALQVLALIGFFSSKAPPEWSVWLTSIEGRLTSRSMGSQDLADIPDLTHADAGAAIAFLCHVVTTSDGYAQGECESHHFSVSQALLLVQTLFGVAPGEARSAESLIHLLSVRAHAPKSVWRADTEFSIAVTGILHLVGVEVNHLEFEAPEGRAAHSIGAKASCITGQGEGQSPTLREVASVPSNTRQCHRSTMRVGTLQHDLETEKYVIQEHLQNIIKPPEYELEKNLRKGLLGAPSGLTRGSFSRNEV